MPLLADGQATAPLRRPPDAAAVEGSEFHHDFHFSYNRRLSCYSHAVSSLSFSKGGSLLLSAAGPGDVKLWDTGSWSEAGRLKNVLREQVKLLCVSPGQRWLVVAYPSFLQVFSCAPPWKLEYTASSPVDDFAQGASEWCALTFSPFADAELEEGRNPFDQLAASTAQRLLTLDFSRGWSAGTASQSRSLHSSGGRPTALCYTACGRFIVCGYSTGHMQVWGASSLTLEKTLIAHEDAVACLASSPRHTPYEPRVVSCSIDQTLRVWNCQGWSVEQHIHDLRCDRGGIRSVQFSCAGDWLLSLGTELCIWRVIPGRTGRIYLGLHQRLSVLCGGDGVRSVAFGRGDALAVGSRDGVLGILTKSAGLPPVASEEGFVTSGCPERRAGDKWMPPEPVVLVRDRALNRHAQRMARLSSSLRPESGVKRPRPELGSAPRPRTGLQRRPSMSMSQTTTAAFPTGLSAAAPATPDLPVQRAQSSPVSGNCKGGDLLGEPCPASPSRGLRPRASSTPAPRDAGDGGGGGSVVVEGARRLAESLTLGRAVPVRRNSLQRVESMPGLVKVKTQDSTRPGTKFSLAESLPLDLAGPRSPFGGRRLLQTNASTFVVSLSSPSRKSMQRVCKGLVQRISLDPKSITAEPLSGDLDDG